MKERLSTNTNNTSLLPPTFMSRGSIPVQNGSLTQGIQSALSGLPQNTGIGSLTQSMQMRNMQRSLTLGKMFLGNASTEQQQQQVQQQFFNSMTHGVQSPAKQMLKKEPEPPSKVGIQERIFKKRLPSANQRQNISSNIPPGQQHGASMKPPKNPTLKGSLIQASNIPSVTREQATGGSVGNRLSAGNNVIMPSIDHAKQRMKLQELMNKLMNSDDDDNSKTDIIALYESLNPAKRNLLPLEYQAILRLRGWDGSAQGKQLPALQKLNRPPSGDDKRAKSKDMLAVSHNKTHSSQLSKIDHNLHSEKQYFNVKNTRKLKKETFVAGEVDKVRSSMVEDYGGLPDAENMVLGMRKRKKSSALGQRSKLNSQKSNRSNGNQAAATTNNTTSTSADITSQLNRQSSRKSVHPMSDDTMEEAEEEVSKQAIQKAKIAQYQLQLEKDLEVRDRFHLFSWGLRLKEGLLRRRYFLEAVNELKSKLRKVLYMWQDKKAEENFMELAMMIENYDKDDPYYQKKKLGKLTKHKRPIKITKEPVLQTVDEREEEDKGEDDESRIIEQQEDDGAAHLLEMLQREAAQEEETKRLQLEQQMLQQAEENRKAELQRQAEVLKQKVETQQKEKEQYSLAIQELQLEMVEINVKAELQRISRSIQIVVAFLKMIVHRRRYVKVRKEIQRRQEEQKQEQLLAEQERLRQEQFATLNETAQTDQTAYQKRMVTKQEAVFLIERCWIRFRQHQEGLKIREFLRGVPYECRRSYVKYFDLKFKTIRLKTDVDNYARRNPK